MIISPFEQGSKEWLLSRLGIPTASRFSDIMTTKQLKRAKNAYIYELIAEKLSGEITEIFNSDAMNRGEKLEPLARDYYEFVTGQSVRQVGLIKSDCQRFGCSPDGLIDYDNGGLEIKCPGLKKHLEYLINDELPNEYAPQVYGSLFITERDYWDFMSYHPNATEFLIRVHKTDEAYIKWSEAFTPILDEFLNDLEQKYQFVLSKAA